MSLAADHSLLSLCLNHLKYAPFVSNLNIVHCNFLTAEKNTNLPFHSASVYTRHIYCITIELMTSSGDLYVMNILLVAKVEDQLIRLILPLGFYKKEYITNYYYINDKKRFGRSVIGLGHPHGSSIPASHPIYSKRIAHPRCTVHSKTIVNNLLKVIIMAHLYLVQMSMLRLFSDH
uniref:ANK_REP_REGION domain-containing protein n=1 Tax=Heterorhabditis bacteriophora TaxID=37862 RepID=A0A1I7WQL5_HETBA